MIRFAEWFDTHQPVVFSVILISLLVIYRQFLWYLGRFFLHRPVQATTLVIFFALLYGQLGQGLGLPLLFWSEEPWTRFFVAFCSTLVLATIGLNGYYMLPEENREDAMTSVFEFLGEPTVANPTPGKRNLAYRIIRRISGFVFLDFRAFDPEFEPGANNAYELSRFLRLARLPFLMLLVLPALLPTFFENNPRFAPIVTRIDDRELLGPDFLIAKLFPQLGTMNPDVGQVGPAYFYALVIWIVGVWLAVMLVKLIVVLSPGAGRLFEPLVAPIGWLWSTLAGIVGMLVKVVMGREVRSVSFGRPIELTFGPAVARIVVTRDPQGQLHFRVVNPVGRLVVDEGEAQFGQQAAAIVRLNATLAGLAPGPVATPPKKTAALADLKTIVGAGSFPTGAIDVILAQGRPRIVVTIDPVGRLYVRIFDAVGHVIVDRGLANIWRRSKAFGRLKDRLASLAAGPLAGANQAAALAEITEIVGCRFIPAGAIDLILEKGVPVPVAPDGNRIVVTSDPAGPWHFLIINSVGRVAVDRSDSPLSGPVAAIYRTFFKKRAAAYAQAVARLKLTLGPLPAGLVTGPPKEAALEDVSEIVGRLFKVDLFDQARRHRKVSVATYLIFATLIFGLMAWPFYDAYGPVTKDGYFTNYQGVAPAVAILAALSSLAFYSTFLRIFLPTWGRVAVVVLLVGFISWNNRADDSFRFPKMDYARLPKTTPPRFKYDLASKSEVSELYPKDAASKPTEGGVTPPEGQECRPLIGNDEALTEWRKQFDPDKANPPKLVIVCTSGGATRAGYWTATVLDRLGREIAEAKPKPPYAADVAFDGDFHRHVRLITGASGGMVGASYYVTWLRDQIDASEAVTPPGALPKEKWVDKVPINSLMKVARFLTLRETLLTVSRRLVNWLGYFPDRGVELDRDWAAINYPISNLRKFEATGQIPSLVFTPMTVEDGRRLLISNLDLKVLNSKVGPPPKPSPDNLLAVTRGSLLAPNGDFVDLSPMSMTGIEYFKVFCHNTMSKDDNELNLATAVRMSASFPYVSPAVNLPTFPPLRVVDAGYYDNYGVDIAATWVFANRDWLMENTSGVAIIQIRDALSVNDRFGYAQEDDGVYAEIFRGLQFFTSPIDGVARARYSSSAFRNDALLAGLSDYFSEKKNRRDFFTTAIFELSSRTVQPIRRPVWDWPGDGLDFKIKYADSSQSTDVAMSWYLTVAEREAIDMAIPSRTRPDGFGDPYGYTFGSGTDRTKLMDVLGIKDTKDSKPSEFRIEAGDLKRDDDRAIEARLNQIMQLRSDLVERMKKEPEIPDRALDVVDKELARAQNFARCRTLIKWWGRR